MPREEKYHRVEEPLGMGIDLGDRWRLYYDPLTLESGLRKADDITVFMIKLAFIGPFPIRQDVPVLPYTELEVPRFSIWDGAVERAGEFFDGKGEN